LAVYEFINYLQNYGFFEYVVPFLIAYLIVFAILEKTSVFGKNKTNMNAILALLFAFTVIANDRITEFIGQYLSNVTVGLIFISVVILVFESVLGVQNGALRFVTIIFAISTVLWALFETKYFQGGGAFFGGFGDVLLYLRPFMQEFLLFVAFALVIAIPIFRSSKGSSVAKSKGT